MVKQGCELITNATVISGALLYLKFTEPHDYKSQFQDLIRRSLLKLESDKEPNNEELFWMLVLCIQARFPQEHLINLIDIRLHQDWEIMIEECKQEGWLPANITPLEVATIIISPEEVTKKMVPVSHPIWLALNVKKPNVDWYSLSSYERLNRLARMAKTGEINRWIGAWLGFLKREYLSKGYVPTGSETNVDIEQFTDEKSTVQLSENIELNDNERLTKFVDLAGIDLDDFTAKEQDRMLELMRAHNEEYKKSSKRDLSYKQYYGNRADSEKTQRSRLFKKVRKLTTKDRLKD